jgi:hypothetical protein
MAWYFAKGGVQTGPVTEADLRSKLRTGEISSTDLVWREGMKDWQSAGEVADLAMLPVPSVPQRDDGGEREDSPYVPPASQVQAAGDAEYLPNYLWQSIVVTIFCCWPFGIPAIVYSAKVDGLKAGGDLKGARVAAMSARNWCWAAVVSWGGLIVFWLLSKWVGQGVSGY